MKSLSQHINESIVNESLKNTTFTNDEADTIFSLIVDVLSLHKGANKNDEVHNTVLWGKKHLGKFNEDTYKDFYISEIHSTTFSSVVFISNIRTNELDSVCTLGTKLKGNRLGQLKFNSSNKLYVTFYEYASTQFYNASKTHKKLTYSSGSRNPKYVQQIDVTKIDDGDDINNAKALKELDKEINAVSAKYEKAKLRYQQMYRDANNMSSVNRSYGAADAFHRNTLEPLSKELNELRNRRNELT